MKNQIAVLIAQANNTIKILEDNRSYYMEFIDGDYKKLGQTTASAIVFSQIFIDYYTCIETFLFRCSQTFENNLEQEKWHKSLLQKMSLDIPNIRPAIVRKETFEMLDELLRFRHFRRYYFNFSYDWDKIDLLSRKYDNLHDYILEDIQNFKTFLNQLLED
jgi:hypothetical protein